MSQIVYPQKLNHGGAAQFTEKPSTWRGYQYKDDVSNNFLYLDGSTLGTATVSGTATATLRTVDSPKGGETIFSSRDLTNIPFTGRKDTPYYRIGNGATATSPIKFNFVRNLSLDYWAAITIRQVGGSPVAGKFKIRSSGTNERIYSFTTTGTGWAKFQFQTLIDGIVGAGGEPVWASITEIEFTLDTLNTSIDVAFVETANTVDQIIGFLKSVEYGCISEAEMEDVAEAADIRCGQKVDGKIPTSDSVSVTLKTMTEDPNAMALRTGEVIVQELFFYDQLYNNATVGRRAVASSTTTIAAGLDIVAVYFGDVKLERVTSASNIPVNGYFYSGTSLQTNATQVADGQILTIKIRVSSVVNTRKRRPLRLALIGELTVSRKTRQGIYKTIVAPKAQPMIEPESAGDVDTVGTKFFMYYDSATDSYYQEGYVS
jgi:hypothetical protein